MLSTWKKSYDKSRQHIKKQGHYFADKCPSSQSYGFSSSHVCMWDLDHKEAEPQRIDAFELSCWRTPETLLDWMEIKSINPKGNQSWIFTGKTDAEVEASILWPPDVKRRLIRRDPDARKDWRQEDEGANRGGYGWIASVTQWTWVWASSGRWWRTGKSGVLQSLGSQITGHYWETEQQQQLCIFNKLSKVILILRNIDHKLPFP